MTEASVANSSSSGRRCRSCKKSLRSRREFYRVLAAKRVPCDPGAISQEARSNCSDMRQLLVTKRCSRTSRVESHPHEKAAVRLRSSCGVEKRRSRTWFLERVPFDVVVVKAHHNVPSCPEFVLLPSWKITWPFCMCIPIK